MVLTMFRTVATADATTLIKMGSIAEMIARTSAYVLDTIRRTSGTPVATRLAIRRTTG